MSSVYAFGPLLAQVLLVVIVYLELGRRRFREGKARRIKFDDYKILPNDEIDYLAQATRNVVNQFELPVLFFVLVISIAVTDTLGFFQLLLLWGFVVSRYLHAYSHLTSNDVSVRGALFLTGFGLLAVAYLLFALRLVFGPVAVG
ncbi:MAG: MAPEG family protein [Pseudomonadota bacterium]